jgi:hypothetical protein
MSFFEGIAFMRIIRIVLLTAAAASFGSCRHKAPPEPALATPSVTLSLDRAPLGSPIEVTYRFDVAPDAPPFAEDYIVFVGVVDGDQELMWTDDHDPPVPTRQWKPGQRIEYVRTVFIPVYPYIGDASFHMGLYSRKTQKRLPLAGQDTGQRAYNVAKLQLLPQTESILTTPKEGWHGPENPPNNPAPHVEWQWTKKKQATLAFKNPKKDSVFYLDLDFVLPPIAQHQAGAINPFPEGQHVLVRLGDQIVDDFKVETDHRLLRKIPLTAAQLGSQDMAEVALVVDKTFVPALLPGATSADPRELGIRVFHTYVEPKK